MNYYAAGGRSYQMNLSPAISASRNEAYVRCQTDHGIEYPTPHKIVLGSMNDWARDAYYYNVPTGNSKRSDIEKGCMRLDIRAAADEQHYRTFLEKPGRAENEWQPLVSTTQITELDLSRPRNENDTIQFDSASSDSLGPLSLASSPVDSPSEPNSGYSSSTSVVSTQGLPHIVETPVNEGGERKSVTSADLNPPNSNKATPRMRDNPSDEEQISKAKTSPNLTQYVDKHTSRYVEPTSRETESKQQLELTSPQRWQAHPIWAATRHWHKMGTAQRQTSDT